MFPYRIRVFDKDMENILDRLAKDRTVTIKTNKELMRTLGKKLQPLRKEYIFIGPDSKFYESNISLKLPTIRIEKNKKDYIFRI